METQVYDKVEEYNTLEYMDNNSKHQTYEPTPPRHRYNVYFDCETNTSAQPREPYLVRYETEGGDRRDFICDACALDM